MNKLLSWVCEVQLREIEV